MVAALSVYEVAGGGPLPKNGEVWHTIRNGELKYLHKYSKDFNNILKVSHNQFYKINKYLSDKVSTLSKKLINIWVYPFLVYQVINTVELL